MPEVNMSDVLLVGRAPQGAAGKEFFLHCADWWYDILAVIDVLLGDRFPVEEHFERDLLIAPPTPHLDGQAARELADLLEAVVTAGDVEVFLKKRYRDELEVEADLIEGYVADRVDQIAALVAFLRFSGGCDAKWWTGKGASEE
jgi:hypothetical protein